MALILCPECGKQISDMAESCPICGFPINPIEKIITTEDSLLTRNRGCGDIVLYGFFIIVLIVVIGSISTN